MKKEQLEQNIYFVIQPLHFVSRILGLSPFHIDTNYTFRNKGGCTFRRIIQAAVMILFSLYGLCNNVLDLVANRDPMFNVIVRIVWIIHVLVLHLTSILTILFTVTRNRNHMTNTLCLLSRVDNKLFRNKSKQSAYSQQRSHVITQLWITLILYAIVVASLTYTCAEGTWKSYANAASIALSNLINVVMLFQYVIIVQMVKQRYQQVKHVLSEAAITDDESYLTQTNVENLKSSKNDQVFSIVTYNLKSGKESRNLCRIHNFRVIYSELCALLNYNNKSCQVTLLLDVIARLTFTVPTLYQGVMFIKVAILENGPFLVYFKGISMLFCFVFMLFSFMWLNFGCQKTTEEVDDIFNCIQNLLLYPNALGWSTSELKKFSSQMKNHKVQFIVCGFFTLNLQFFCASLSVIFTYILVLNQFSQGL
jgi:hypothetical protein